MLQHRNLVPGIERNDRLQHRRQVLDLPQYTAPLFQPPVLIPVEIIDQRILFPGLSACDGAGLLGLFNGGLRSGQHRIDGGKFFSKQAGVILAVLPLSSLGSVVCTSALTVPIAVANK